MAGTLIHDPLCSTQGACVSLSITAACRNDRHARRQGLRPRALVLERRSPSSPAGGSRPRAPRRSSPGRSMRPGRSCRSRHRSRTKRATWSTGGSCPTCAGSPPAIRSTSPTATPARCPAAGTSAATCCHVRNSDHYNGLAVDIVPLGGGSRCDASWRPITRLAHWAEPRQNRPRPPFRWVGYNGDAGHGCGNHLHLSWEHAVAPMFRLAQWVEVFAVRRPGRRPSRHSRARRRRRPPASSRRRARRAAAKPSRGSGDGPQGGVSTVQSGGVSPRGD